MSGLAKDLWQFLKAEKKWWLVPMLLVVAVVGVLVVRAVWFANAAPFVYTH